MGIMGSDLTALIMCGGRGARLGPLGDIINKNLLPVDGAPILVGTVRLVRELFECERFVFLTGHLSSQVEHVVRAYFPELKSSFIKDECSRGTAASVARALQSGSRGRFVYAHGNVSFGANATQKLSQAISEIGPNGSLLAVSSAERAPTHPKVCVDEGYVIERRVSSSARPLFSVGLAVLRSMPSQVESRSTVERLALEDVLFNRPDGIQGVHALDIGEDWRHLEDLTFYKS